MPIQNTGKEEYRCKCGALFLLSPKLTSYRCPFCGLELIFVQPETPAQIEAPQIESPSVAVTESQSDSTPTSEITNESSDELDEKE